MAFLWCFLKAHPTSTDAYNIRVKIVNGPEYMVTVYLPSPTVVGDIKSAVQEDLKNNFHIHIPSEKLILGKEGGQLGLPKDTDIRPADRIYIIGRAPH